MGSAATTAGNTSVDAGAACYRAYTACQSACDVAGNSSSSNTCQQLSSKVQANGTNGLNNYNAAKAGDNCNNMASASPQSAGGSSDPNAQANAAAAAAAAANAADPFGCAQNPSSAVCQNCQINPNSPSCKALNEGQTNPTGKANFTVVDKKTGGTGDFDVPDMNANATGQILPASANPTQALQGHGIPNGGGGGIPGDQNSRPAQGDPPRRGGSAGAPGFNVADIEQGMRGGGYSSAPGGGELNPGGNGANGQQGNGNRMPASAGVDLKKYLPGQRLDPMNRMGGNSMVSAEINGKSCDMFKKISARIQEKCKLGVLFGCH